MSSELIFGLFCLVFVVGTFWLSAVFEGRRRDREQKTQQVVEETSDPRAVVRVLASVRLQASWFIKMLLWVTLILLALMLYAMIQLRISGVPLDTGDWVGIGLLIVFTPGAVWGLWVCRVSYREILPEKLIRVTNRGRKLTLHYWQIDSSYFTLLGDENGLFELTDTAGVVYRFNRMWNRAGMWVLRWRFGWIMGIGLIRTILRMLKYLCSIFGKNCGCSVCWRCPLFRG